MRFLPWPPRMPRMFRAWPPSLWAWPAKRRAPNGVRVILFSAFLAHTRGSGRGSISLGGPHSAAAASTALQELAPAALYELGNANSSGTMNFYSYPPYLRGIACLAAGQGPAAAVEFRKILDHPSIVSNEIIGALAHLGLARAYALSGDSSKIGRA